MDFLQYFRDAHALESGFPLNPSQVEAFVGASQFGKGRFNLDPRFTLEMGWNVAALDVDRFCAAVRSAVCRHQVLRTKLHAEAKVPYQQSVAELSDRHFLKIFPAAATLDEATAAARSFTRLIAPDGDSPLRVAIAGAEGRHCVIFGVHHFFCDAESLGRVVRDVWLAYEGVVLGEGPSVRYQELCTDIAAGMRNDGRVDRHLSYWRGADRSATPPDMEPDSDPEMPERIAVRTCRLAGGAQTIGRVAQSLNVLPVSVALAASAEALAAFLPADNDITFLVGVNGSRVDPRLATEAQYANRHLPVTFSAALLHLQDRAVRIRGVMDALFQTLRYAGIPPAALSGGRAPQASATMFNYLTAFPKADRISPTLPAMEPISRPTSYEDHNEEDRNQGTKSMVIQMIAAEDSVTVAAVRRARRPESSDVFLSRLQDIFAEMLDEFSPAIANKEAELAVSRSDCCVGPTE